jgi:prepilin-type processing-associated H-X9-DG protein
MWPFRSTIVRNDLPPSACPSYVLKKAINEACLDSSIKARKEDDFSWPAEQIAFYERGSFHWDNTAGDLSDPKNPKKLGATTNCFFIDGHVKAMRLTQFEPDYYNTYPEKGTQTKRPQIDPRQYCDTLN